MLVLILSLLACSGDDDPAPPPDDTETTTSTTETTADTGSSSTTPTATTGSTGSTASTATTGFTGDTAAEYDCTAPWPKAPISITAIPDFSTAEDFDFDGAGYVVAMLNQDLRGKDMYGNTIFYSANVTGSAAGTRVLKTGDFVVADVAGGAIVRIDATTGAQEVILSGLAYPNGLEVDEDDNVYIGENSGNRVIRVNAYNPSDFEAIATGITQPNGVILSPDGQTLYVGSFGGGKIFAIDRDPSGVGWQPHRTLYEPTGPDSGFDGINVDICGNVYITEFISGHVYRISPDGTETALVADLPSSWIPNLRWGVGVGGWDPDTLYVADRDQGRLFAIDVGIPGKPHILAP